jgi:DNA-binding XRE family transcriptional regulator
MNQTQFAEIFDIKRASIGAYEEGRAEPKLETLLKIVGHFKLKLDDIIVKELTVNQIAKFDKAYDKANTEPEINISKEFKNLKLKISKLEEKIDTLINKS